MDKINGSFIALYVGYGHLQLFIKGDLCCVLMFV